MLQIAIQFIISNFQMANNYAQFQQPSLSKKNHPNWVKHYAPRLEENFRKGHKQPVVGSWRCDETYLRLKGKWSYLYRAVDKQGKTVDFMLSQKRDRAAAQSFFAKSLNHSGLSHTITIDKSGANKAGIEAINLHLALLFVLGGIFYQIDIRQIKYLNNIVEADHRFIKKITKPMMGFKSFDSAIATIAGIELHHMLRKGQHNNAANMTLFEQFQELAA